MDTLIYPTHCEIVVDSPDNDDDIRELGRICKEWLLNKQIVLLRRQNTDSNYFAKLSESIARDGIYNWRQCSWMPNGDLIELPDQVAGNIGYTATPEANSDPWNNSKKLAWNSTTAAAIDKTLPRINPFDLKEPNTYPVQRVTGEKKGKFGGGIFGTGDLDWHCNLGNYYEADGVGLQAIKDAESASTFYANSVPALKEMPAELRARCEGKRATFLYDHKKWSDVSKMHPMQRITMQFLALNLDRREMEMNLIQKNRKGIEGIYFHRLNNMKIEGDETLVQDLYDWMFQDKYVYEHRWETGDIIFMDQLITQHKREFVAEELLEKRVLHRFTFMVNNDDEWVKEQNSI